MIVTSPTGLYDPVLPTVPDDPTSIIFTISNQDPPRSPLNFNQIPTGILNTQRPARIYSQTDRRQILGDLAFVAKSRSKVKVGSGAPLFAIGQILEFTTIALVQAEIDATETSVETRHNLHVVDFDLLGLSTEEQSEVTTDATTAYRTLLNSIAELYNKRKTYEGNIADLQRTINELTKAIDGLAVVAATGIDITSINIKLTGKRTAAQTNLNDTMALLETVSKEIAEKRSALVVLAGLVQ